MLEHDYLDLEIGGGGGAGGGPVGLCITPVAGVDPVFDCTCGGSFWQPASQGRQATNMVGRSNRRAINCRLPMDQGQNLS
jgi:hypothetical protein